MSRKFSSVVGSAVIIIIALLVFSNRQWIRDEYVVRTTSLSATSQAVGQDIELTDQAIFTYRASQPEIKDAQTFNTACRDVAREQSIVLGCYTQQRIYVYDVKDTRLNGVKQVTAAHELLHATYARMPATEKAEVDKLLETTAANISDQRFNDTLAEYRRTEPDQINNELHSIIGTEIAVVPAALEKHYQKYFKNRQKIINYSKQYESTFTELDSQIKSYDSQLIALRSQKETLEKTLNTQQALIAAESSRLNSLKSSGNTSAYNNAVPPYNDSIKRYNDNIASLRQVVARYNELVVKRNELATTQNDLTKQLNSNYQPLR